MSDTQNMQPLHGVTVLDFTQFLSGPYCTMMLSDMGAEVIKLEHPPLGDPTRYVFPGKGGAATSFASPNRGKKSVLMDLKDPAQKEIFFEMVKKADIVIDNFKPGTMKKLGADYETLKAINPSIIMTEISGFGTTGPWSSRAAYDMIVQAASGLMSVTGEFGGQPVRVGASYGDVVGGMGACIATLMALYRKQRTGVGAYIDCAMLDNLFATLEAPVARYSINGVVPKPFGSRHPQSAPFQPFTCKDGKKVFICCSTDEHWQTLCKLLGNPDLAFDERFTQMGDRQTYIEEMDEEVSKLVVKLTSDELKQKMQDNGLVYGELQTIPEVMECDQIKARDMICEVDYYGKEGKLLSPATPFFISGAERTTKSYVYAPGYHTIDVIKEYVGEEKAHEIYDDLVKRAKELGDERLHRAGLD